MSRASRIAAIALCVGLVVGIAGQLGGLWDVPAAVGTLSRADDEDLGKEGPNQAASSIPKVDEGTRLQAAQVLMSARVAAVKAGNKKSWMATVDVPGSAGKTGSAGKAGAGKAGAGKAGAGKAGIGGKAFRERQSVVFDNLMRLPLGTFSYGAVRMAPPLTATRVRQVGPRAWAATFVGSYSLTGFSRAPQPFEATYTLVRRPAGWRISDDTDGPTPLQVWDLPGLRVLRGRSTVVIGNAPADRMRGYATIADSAVRRVAGVWGDDWNSHVVLVTPSTDDEFARLLLRSGENGLDQVAAITQGSIAPGQRAQGDRVVINPRAFTALQPIGRRVVITHELAHVAARSSTTTAVPIWLTEGMADYIGYSGLDIPRERVASELLALVRAGKGPTALPTDIDFEPSRSQIARSYTGSWLAVSLLVDRYGQARVVAFYRALASAGTAGAVVQLDPQAAAASAFPRTFGVSQPQFVNRWRRYLRTLANASS